MWQLLNEVSGRGSCLRELISAVNVRKCFENTLILSAVIKMPQAGNAGRRDYDIAMS